MRELFADRSPYQLLGLIICLWCLQLVPTFPKWPKSTLLGVYGACTRALRI